MICQECYNIAISSEYCMICGKTLCSKCRIVYFCSNCNEEEKSIDEQIILTSKLKYVLLQLHDKLQLRDYCKITEMIRYWFCGKISRGDNILIFMKGLFTSETYNVLKEIEKVVANYKNILPLDVIVPNNPYREIKRGFYIAE